MVLFRQYDDDKDNEAARRIFREVGWWDGSQAQGEAIDSWFRTGQTMVAEMAGSAECIVIVMQGTFRHGVEDLPMAAVTSVATGYAGRKQGLASHLAACSVAQAAQSGALVAGLGMFEQGYYDQLGFGTGAYELRANFDPATLITEAGHRAPRRLGQDDWEAMHAARLRRLRRHGAACILPPVSTRGEMRFSPNGFGLGYHDGPGGTLSHYFWGGARNMEHGPLWINWLIYETREQFLELISLLKSLGDQFRQVSLTEPPGVQMQSLISKPFKQYEISRGSTFAASMRASAFWQLRICDLPGCLERTHLPGPEVRFNLHLSDPIARYLEADAPWRGVGGDYVVTLGPTSGAEPGHTGALPTLTATVNAFTRLWMGVGPATGLAMTDRLAGPPELLAQLDGALRLPAPHLDWEF